MKLDSLISNVKNNCDVLTNDCIILMSNLCKQLGISYGELNVYVFLIIIPALLLYFISTTLICVHTKNSTIKQTIKYITYSIIMIIICVLIYIMRLILNQAHFLFITIK